MDILLSLIGKSGAHPRARLVEMLLVLPALLLAIWTLGTWSVYFWMQHEAQVGANLALSAVRDAPVDADLNRVVRAAARRALAAPVCDVVIERAAGRLSLRLAYDVSASPLFSLPRITPPPPPIIVRYARDR